MTTTMLWFDQLRALSGIAVILGIAWLLSENRRAISSRTVIWGLVLQFGFAVLVLKWETGKLAMQFASDGIARVLGNGIAGAQFVFGEKLTDPAGPWGFVFAFRVLPSVIFVSALFAVLYHLGIMQRVVQGFAWVMSRLMRTSGPESLNAAASVFLGQTEAPLTIRPYLAILTRSELLTVMVAGMATVSGGVMVAYFEVGVDPRHILTASIMAAPAAIVLAKIMVPETAKPQIHELQTKDEEALDANLLDAIARGTRDGLTLALNIGAMLIAFLGLIALLNMILGLANTSLGALLGILLSPLAWLMGVPWRDCSEVGGLLGTRTVTNELVAYLDWKTVRTAIEPRSAHIAAFALCGFANLSSIGIQIGGIGALVPERRKDLAELGVRALIAATLANFLSACLAGLLL